MGIIKDKKLLRQIIPAAISLPLIVCASVLLPYYEITINRFFLGQGADFGEYNDEKARVVCEKIEEESVVLLKNENNVLPLTTNKVSLFGVGAYHMRFAGSGSGGGDASDAIKFHEALSERGIEYNQDLYEYYFNKGTGATDTGGFDDVGSTIGSTEISINGLTDTALNNAKNFSDTAIYVLTRVGGEGSGLTNALLNLTAYEEKTLDYIVENYDKVIVLLNTSNAMECGFIDGEGTSRATGESYSKYKDKIDSCMYVGLAGTTGSRGIVDVLKGVVSPSGRLASTYAYDVESSLSTNAVGNAEGIYIGYKWYETAAYENVINYDSYTPETVEYANVDIATGVKYPFGYGLSYTMFEKEIVDCSKTTNFSNSNKNETITIDVKITNTGNVKGKEVVQLYYTPNYINGGIEKAYVNLVDFAKTSELEPNASETVTLKVKVSDLKSYDYLDANKDGFKGYTIDKGAFSLRVLDNAHDWVNVSTNSALAKNYQVDSTITWDKDPETGADVANLFENYYGGRNFVSRADGFDNLEVNLEANIQDFKYQNPDITKEVNKFTKGVDYAVELEKPIMLEEMQDVARNDPKWDTFISQFTKTELASLIALGCFQTSEIERLGIPKTLLFDGPACIKDTYMSDKGCLLYPSECTIGCCWNKQMLYEFGASAADDARQCGVTGWYAPGVNLHVNPYVGRAFEYFSEDAYLTGIYAAEESKGTYDNGLLVIVKHLIDGLSSTINEQSLREIYARPFELSIKEGESHGLMTSDDVLGTWVGQVKEIITDLIREEWEFIGMITSDAASQFMKAEYGIRAGNDIWLATDNGRFTYLVRDEKNVGVMQERAKNILQTILMSPNSLGIETSDYGWSPSLLIMGIVDGVAGLVLVWSIVSTVLKLRKKEI